MQITFNIKPYKLCCVEGSRKTLAEYISTNNIKEN